MEPNIVTLGPFRHPERMSKFVNLFPRYDPLRPCLMPMPSIQEIRVITTVDPFSHPERTWPNLAIYVSAMTHSDPVRRPHLRFKRSLVEPR